MATTSHPQGVDCAVTLSGNSEIVDEALGDDPGDTPTILRTKDYTNADIVSAGKTIRKKQIYSALTLPLTISVEDLQGGDRGAITGIIGAISNYSLFNNALTALIPIPMGASGTIAINGGRPF